MALATKIDGVGNYVASGTTLDTSSLTILAGDVLAVRVGYSAAATQNPTVAATNGTNVVTLLAEAASTTEKVALGYVLAASAFTGAFRVTVDASVARLTLYVNQYRLATGASVLFDAGPSSNTGVSTTTVESGIISTGAADAIVFTGSQHALNQTVSAPYIGGVSADTIITNNRSAFWDRICISSQTNIIGSATLSAIANWTASVASLKLSSGDTHSYTGIGSITLSGSATYFESNDYLYIGIGSIELSGVASTSHQSTGDNYSYTGVGSIELSGAASTSELNNYSYTGVGSITLSGSSNTVGYTLVIDHTFVDKYNLIPDTYITEIKKMWYDIAGESHSIGYRYGLQYVEDLDAKYSVNILESGTPEMASVQTYLRASRASWGDYDSATGWQYSYGEEDWYTNSAAIAQTKVFLQYAYDNAFGLSVLGFGWCWDMTQTNTITVEKDPVYKCGWDGSCIAGPEGNLVWGLDSGDFSITNNTVCMDTYLNATKEYIDYCTTNNIPTKVIYTTGPVDGYVGESGYQRHVKHEYIRDYVNAHGGILFDYADILAWDNAGNENLLSWVDAESTPHDYQEIANDNLLDFDEGQTEAYGHIGQKGCLRLGKASWVLLAYIAGWDGTAAGTYTGVGSIELSGSATTLESNNYVYSPSGNITFTGSAITSGGSSYSYTGTGLIELSGSGVIVETNNYNTTGIGSFELSGAATTSYTTAGSFNYTGVGSIDFSGNNIGTLNKNFIYSTIGEIDLLGGSTTLIDTKNYLITGSGQLLFTGSAITSYVTPDTKLYTGIGSIDFSGSADMPRIINSLSVLLISVKQPSLDIATKYPSLVCTGNGS